MHIYCYHHDLQDAERPCNKGLIDRWRSSWSLRGFTPVLLTEENARLHPRFSEIDAIVSEYPTTNYRVFERACWLRWLAYALKAPGLFSDYDCINFTLTPDMVPEGEGLLPLEAPVSPAFFYSTESGINCFIDAIGGAGRLITQFNGGQHVCDMLLMRDIWPYYYKALATSYVDIIVGRSELAHCVNFNNGGVRGMGLDTCQVMDEFSALNGICIQ